MGVVYKAFDPAIHRQVAIKTITKSVMDPSELQYAIARFRHEAQAVGRLTHPRIAAIFDYGEDENLAYIVMELVHGRSLYDHLQNKAKFDLAEIGEIIRQLLDGLGYAHAQRVVHRDIKPSNLLINDDGRIKISDFGIAHLDTSSLTQVGEIMGSPGYMSPEQFSGDEPDARTDLYATGVIAYELLAGRKPFTASNVEIMRQVIGERPPIPLNSIRRFRRSWNGPRTRRAPKNVKIVSSQRVNLRWYSCRVLPPACAPPKMPHPKTRMTPRLISWFRNWCPPRG